MGNVVKKSRKEDFPISEELVSKFCALNRNNWEKSNVTNERMLINMSMVRMQIPWILPKLLYAKGLEEKTGAKPVVLTWNNNELLEKFFDSFGIEHISLNYMCKRNITGAIKAMVRTILFVVFDGTGEGLKQLKISKIRVGNNIYEDILRTSSLSTIRTCRHKVVFKKLFHLLLSAYTIKKYINKRHVSYAITDDMAYHEGLFIKLFIINNVKTIACSNVAVKEVHLDSNGEVLRHNWHDTSEVKEFVNNASDEEVMWTEKYLEERFRGKNGRNIDRQAFVGKTVLSRQELINMYNIDNTRKNVVIMAHTFTDAVFNYGEYYFRDYYDWTEQTLKLASSVNDVNWILKPHPTRSSYNESEDSIEDMFLKYKKDNMFILSDDISSESIKNMADVIITIGGNAGAEYACFGIPSIIVGKPYYHGQGYTIEPQSLEEYISVIKNIADIPRLNDEQIMIAKKVFCFMNRKNEKSKELFNDEFAEYNNNIYREMLDKISLQYFKNNDGTQNYNDDALKSICGYMTNNNIKETEYYCRALM